jgi:glycosyltransferase involved in cell wall biosynthesis
VLAWRDLAHPGAGGSELYVERIARHWVAAGHAVTLCCAAVPGRPSREIVHGVEIVRSGNRFTVYRDARRFVMAERRFDIILECINTKPFDSPRVAGSTPVVALIHQVCRDVWWYEAPLPAAAIGRFLLEPRWLRRYRGIPVLTISDSSRESLGVYGIDDITVVPVGVDPSDPVVVNKKSEDPTLVFCGRLVRSKRPVHAIEAFRQLRAKFPDLRLVLIGGGPQAARLARRAPAGVEFAGRLPAAEKQQIVASAHALVVTSVREGWGLVVSEAAALGTPAVGYDVAGLRDSIAAGRGVTCEPRPAALAAAVVESLDAWIEQPPAPLPWGGAKSWADTADAVLAALMETAGSVGTDRALPDLVWAPGPAEVEGMVA